MKIKYELKGICLSAELSKDKSPLKIKKEFTYIKKLCEELLSIGGQRVSIPVANIRSEEIVYTNGKLIKYSEIIKKRQRTLHECHANSAKFWKKNKDTCKLVTGYALLSEGWLSHSWVITNQKQILDFTIQADKYYGAILDDLQAAEFCKQVLKKN